MNLSSYNINNIPREPFGLKNYSSNCYFNSLLQALISCSSFNDEIKITTNSTTNNFCNLVNKLLNEEDREEKKRIGIGCWGEAITAINIPSFRGGSQCVLECFTLLLDRLSIYKNISSLFSYRGINSTYCTSCMKWISENKITGNIFNLGEDLNDTKLDQLFNTNKKKNSTMAELLRSSIQKLEGFHCEKCLNNTKFIKSQLVMVPEILVVGCPKFKYIDGLPVLTDIYKKYEEYIFFNSKKNDVILKYKAVAQIDHLGNIGGGHYYAICKRGIGWFKIDDENFIPAEFSPNSNTYAVIYHYYTD